LPAAPQRPIVASMVEQPSFLSGKLLLAMPGMADPRFERAVIAMCIHDENGAIGVGVGHKRAGITFRGHLMFNDIAAVAVGNAQQVVLVRDPYDWTIARARFFVSDEFKGFDLLKEGTLSIEAILNMMIFGILEQAPPLAALFTYNAVAWLGTGVKLVRYEDLVAALKDLDGDSGERFFAELFDYCGIERPDDWRERVRIGSDRKQSGTARENLTGVGIEFPDELPALQKQMIDFAAPGLRALLGYQ
jgi:hypothetical protein